MERLKIILIVLAGGYLVASMLLYFLQEKLIFQGVALPQDYDFQFDRPYTELNIEVSDDGIINTLHFKADSSKGLIIYYHGNAGNLAGWGHVNEDLVPLGYDLAIMDYRGYGKSQGSRSPKNMLSDALEVFDHYQKNYPSYQVVLYGRSLGTGIAAYVASKREVDKIILETPYHNFTSLVQSHVPVFPASPVLRYKFNTAKYLENNDKPVFIFHGTDDRVVPFKQGRKLYNQLGPESATFIEIQGGHHNNLSEYDEYWSNLRKALQ